MRRIPWRHLLSVVGSIVGLLLLIRQAILGWSALPAFQLSTTTITAMGLGLFSGILAVGMPIAAFYCLLRATGAKVALRDVAHRYTFSFLPRYIPGSIWGYMSRGEWLQRELGISHAISYSASFFELAVAASSGLVFAGELLLPNSWIAHLVYIPACCLLLYVIWATSNQLPQFIHQIPTHWWWRTWLPDQQISLRSWIVTVILYGFHWLLNGLALIFIIQACAPAAANEFAIAMAQSSELYATAWLAGFIVLITPAGMGVRETALTALLVFRVNVPLATAAEIALLLRFLFILAEIFWTLAGVGFFGRCQIPSPINHESGNTHNT